MHQVLELAITFHLPGCDSLKEKRSRLFRLKDLFGKRSELAVRECGLHDQLQQAQWAFVVVAENKRLADSLSQRLEQEIIETIDAQITSIDRYFL